MLEIDRYAAIYDGLHLTEAPVGLVGVADKDAGGKIVSHGLAPSLRRVVEIVHCIRPFCVKVA